MSTISTPTMTISEYLAFEREAETRHEFYRGEVNEMPGGTFNHSCIVSDLLVTTRLALNASNASCDVLESNMRVMTPTELVTYPDLIVYCGEPQLADSYRDTLLNPTVLFEVLSPSTESFDRGAKFEEYSSIPSLAAYVLVSSSRPVVETYERTTTDADWTYRRIVGAESKFSLTNPAVTVPMADIFRRLKAESA